MLRSSIALLTTYYRPVVGGVEAAAEHLARDLARRGHEVTVVTKRVSPGDQAVERLDGVEVQRTGPAGGRRASGKWLAIPGFVRALWRRRSSLRLICCVDYRGIGLAALLMGMLTGAPVVFETSTDGTISGESIRRSVAHLGFAHDGLVARLVTWPIRATYRHADLFLCVSRQIERELIACGVPPERVRYLPHTVDRAVFRPVSADQRRAQRAARALPPGARVAIFVGRLSREKGLAQLLEAWVALDLPDARLLIVGPDMAGHPWDEGPHARQFVAERGLGDQVRLVGGVAPDEVAEWMQLADIAVQPSHYEAFGIAAAEAMAVGLPVVASDVGGFRDYVESGINGLLVPPRDPQALRAAIRRLLTDETARQAMAAGALATAQQFDERLVFDKVAEAMESLAARTGGAAAPPRVVA
jgi:glycosyltransferase involved in cell wall biosynthesis